MDEEVKVPKEKKVKKEKKMSTDAKLDIVIGALGKVVEMMMATKSNDGTVPAPSPTAVFNPTMDDDTYPKSYLPPKFRKIVNEILAPEFGARTTDFEDRTDFQFDIIVPAKYSSLTKEDRARGVEDIRTRIIPRALGENGVREWCQLVRKNLSRYYTQEGKASPFVNNQE